ncbi:MAG: hypothetical protein ACK4GC_15125 [Paracoccaceae bacterium]
MSAPRILLCLSALLPLPAFAQDLASADAIRAAIVGNTVQGSMIASGGFTEYYAPDGAIHGPDYRGEWTINGNRMCFGYDGNPASCWAVRVNGRNVVWVGTGGDEGTGTILSGNPNNY